MNSTTATVLKHELFRLCYPKFKVHAVNADQPVGVAEPLLVEKKTIASLSSDPLVTAAHNSTLGSVPSVAVYRVSSNPTVTPKNNYVVTFKKLSSEIYV